MIESVSYGQDIIEERIVVKGKAIFKENVDRVDLEIDTPEKYAIWPLIWPEKQIPHQRIGIGHPYRFEIIRKVDRSGTSLTKSSSLLSVSDEEMTYYDASICEVHHRRMTRKQETGDDPSTYTATFSRKRWRFFPNDGRIASTYCGYYALGGTWVCESCVERSNLERSHSKLD